MFRSVIKSLPLLLCAGVLSFAQEHQTTVAGNCQLTLEVDAMGAYFPHWNPSATVPLFSTDQYSPTGVYLLTNPAGQASINAFTAPTNGSKHQCGIVSVGFDFPTGPLNAFGGQPTEAHPLPGVNIALLDSREQRPLPEYPCVEFGTVSISFEDLTTHAKQTISIPAELTVQKNIQ